MIFRHGHNCADGPLVCVIPGDDAAPEVVQPTVELLHDLVPGIRFREALSGRAAEEKYGDPFPKETRQLISAADCTVFGASGGPSRAVPEPSSSKKIPSRYDSSAARRPHLGPEAFSRQ